jgi:hypothetical protein
MMSDAERRQSVQKKSQRQPKPASPARKNSSDGRPRKTRRRKNKPIVAIQVDPADGLAHDETLAEVLKGEARTGLPGLGVSILVHVAILGVMALIVAGSQNLGNQDPTMEFGWISAAAAAAGEQDSKPLDIPVNISPIKTVPNNNGDSTTTKTNDPSTPNRGGPVKPADVKNILNGRGHDERAKMLEKYGGGENTERAVKNGLMWLKRRQRAAGNWSLHEGYPNAGYSTLRTDTGATALALMAFLGTGHTHTFGDHQDTVARGLKWLIGVQKTDGNFHDHVELGRQTAFYAHSQATIALCEAFAMTGDENLRKPAAAGVAFLIDSQQPIFGGWKYVPQDDKTIGDLSVTGWALMALHTARVAGLDVPTEAFELSSSFLDTVQEQNGSRYKYEPNDPPDGATAARTAMGLLCRQFLGWPDDHPPMERGIDFITQSKFRPEWKDGRRNVYEWYYVGHVLHNVGGEEWKKWYQAAQEAIVPKQIRLGSNKGTKDVRGSWHPTQPKGSPHEYGDQAGRLYITVMSILILELPYRHLPIYEE